jgi:hypothetical protein
VCLLGAILPLIGLLVLFAWPQSRLSPNHPVA